MRTQSAPLGNPTAGDLTEAAPLVDRFGRVHTDLRVSLTDRCSLRCTYCMPADGLAWLSREEILTDDEVVRLVDISTRRLGITEVRLTEGELPIRRGLSGLVARLAALGPAPELSVTTPNGIGPARTSGALGTAGLRGVNVSLDTLRRERYTAITRRDRLPDVARLRFTRDASPAPVKVNAMPVRGVNDDEIADLTSFAVEHGYRMRFIESMPLGAQDAWDRDLMVTADEISHRLADRFEIEPVPREDNAPTEEWRIVGTDAVVDVIASFTRGICGTCDRVRPTADGQVRNCLFATAESDLRELMHAGGGQRRGRGGLAHLHRRQRPGARHQQRRDPYARSPDVTADDQPDTTGQTRERGQR